LERSKIAIFGYPSLVNPPTEGFPWVDLRKIFNKRSQMAKVLNGVICGWKRIVVQQVFRFSISWTV